MKLEIEINPMILLDCYTKLIRDNPKIIDSILESDEFSDDEKDAIRSIRSKIEKEDRKMTIKITCPECGYPNEIEILPYDLPGFTLDFRCEACEKWFQGELTEDDDIVNIKVDK